MSAAELAFVNGSVYTVDAARTRASAVAVEDGRIVSVGSDDDVRDRIDATTEVLDLRGRMLVPGFQDAHVHPVSGGVDRLQCDLHDLHSVDGYVEAVRSYAEAHPEREWILGGGWSMDVFPGGTPSKDLLDAVVPDRIVFLPNRDGHSAWVNSRALEVGRRHGGHARSGRRPDRARPGRRAERHPPRGCRQPGGRPGARPDARGGRTRDCSRGSGTCIPSGSRPGRTRS